MDRVELYATLIKQALRDVCPHKLIDPRCQSLQDTLGIRLASIQPDNEQLECMPEAGRTSKKKSDDGSLVKQPLAPSWKRRDRVQCHLS